MHDAVQVCTRSGTSFGNTSTISEPHKGQKHSQSAGPPCTLGLQLARTTVAGSPQPMGAVWSSAGTCACANGGLVSNRSSKCWLPLLRQASRKPAPYPPPQPPLGPTASAIPLLVEVKALLAAEAKSSCQLNFAHSSLTVHTCFIACRK